MEPIQRNKNDQMGEEGLKHREFMYGLSIGFALGLLMLILKKW